MVGAPAEAVPGQIPDAGRAVDSQPIVIVRQEGREAQQGAAGGAVERDRFQSRHHGLVAAVEGAVAAAGQQDVVAGVGDRGEIEAADVHVGDLEGVALDRCVAASPGGHGGGRPAPEDAGAGRGRAVGHGAAQPLVHRPVGDQAGLAAGQTAREVAGNLLGRAHRVPDAQLRHLPEERLAGVEAAADGILILAQHKTVGADAQRIHGRGLRHPHQHPVNVDPALVGRTVADHRDVTPAPVGESLPVVPPEDGLVALTVVQPDAAAAGGDDVLVGVAGAGAGNQRLPGDARRREPELDGQRVLSVEHTLREADKAVAAVEGEGRADRDPGHRRRLEVNLEGRRIVVGVAVAVLIQRQPG
ncbi:MAG: hypothetical protein BWZ02_00879 [Lentisphaerae bacterium ADurb.BinA184]|nr:MAG: hypothetical protein BWZ02_00879 [Lentisphaerae bacterium ADurb.BinA184]